MEERTKQNIRGVILIIPLIILIIILVMVARPSDRYATTHDESEVENRVEATDSVTLAAFDPNTADYRTLVESGVPRDVAVGIIRWREAVSCCKGMKNN